MKTINILLVALFSMSFSSQIQEAHFQFPDITENGINLLVFEDLEVIDATTPLSLSAQIKEETELKVVLYSDSPGAFQFTNVKGWEVNMINETMAVLVATQTGDLDLELHFLTGQSCKIQIFENGKEVRGAKLLKLRYDS